jgi:colanic acid/amylovoran biosynthesis glycosyltransferase
VELLANALLKLDADVPIEWVHFGTFMDKDEVYCGNVRQLFRDLENKTDLRFRLMHTTPNHEIRAFYESNKVDLFISVSDSEGIPISMMEAACASIPMIGTRVGGVEEIIHHERNGFLLKATVSEDEIAETILRFINLQPEFRESMGNQSRKIWKPDLIHPSIPGFLQMT